jgi:hypothetical protein
MEIITTSIFLGIMVLGMTVAPASIPWADINNGDGSVAIMQAHFQGLDKQDQDKEDEPEPEPTDPPDTSC